MDSGQARFVSRMFPLISIHSSAQKSAEAAFCAGRQDRFWEMEERLFSTQDVWGGEADPTPTFKQYAAELGLDTDLFDQCVDEGQATLDVNSDSMAAQTFGVDSTPTFFVNDVQLPPLSAEALLEAIDYVGAVGSMPEIMPQGEDFHVVGDVSSARAAMAVFLDYSSPDAAKFMTDVYPQISEAYIAVGSLLFIFHPWAQDAAGAGAQAAAAAECAGEQGKFWEMQATLFEDQSVWAKADLPRDSFAGYARDLGLDEAAFLTCLDGDWTIRRVQAGPLVGMQYGAAASQTYLFSGAAPLTGSPTFDEVKAVLDGMIEQ